MDKLTLRERPASNYKNRVISHDKFEVISLVICLGSLLSGVALAALSLKDPVRARMLERWSGICLVVGLCLLGAALRGAR